MAERSHTNSRGNDANQRDQYVYGDVIHGDKVLGDKVLGNKYIIIQLPDGSRRRIPFQLPTRPKPFTGRKEQLAIVKEALQPGQMLTICGLGGMGKTALAAESLGQLAEEGNLRQRFPGGVLRHNFYNEPEVASAFRTIVKSFLGEQIGPEVLADLPGAAARLLAEKQPLVFLDGTENAEDLLAVQEIRSGCGWLQTSRKRKDARGGQRLDLEPLSAAHSVDLLQNLAGSLAEEPAAKAIAHSVGYLPLALQLAGYHMDEQNMPAVEFLAALERSPLRELDQGKRRLQSVPVLLEKSLAQLPLEATRLLAVAGRLALAPLSPDSLAAALEVDADDLRHYLYPLVDYGILLRDDDLLEIAHALIHTYASRHLEVDSGTLTRLAHFYSGLCAEAWERGRQAYSTLEVARPHVMALLPHLQEAQAWDALLALALAIYEYLDLRGFTGDGLRVAQAALRAAQATGRRSGEGMWLNTLALACFGVGQIREAFDHYGQALAIFQEQGDRRGEAAVLGNLASACVSLNSLEEAKHYYEQALTISREIGDRRLENNQLGNLANAYRLSEQVDKAISYYEQALTNSREVGDRDGEGTNQGNLGLAYISVDRVQEAIECFKQALLIKRETGDRQGEGNALFQLAIAYTDLGRDEVALAYYEQALALARQIGDRQEEADALLLLAVTYSDLGRVEEAIDCHEQGLALARDIGDRRGEGNRLYNLALAYKSQEQLPTAIDYMRQALAAYESIDAANDAEDARARLAEWAER